MTAAGDLPVLYGIPNCDSVRKARAWLEVAGVAYRFHDLRKLGVPADALAAWLVAVGWERLLNRQGTTWRQLDAAARSGVIDAAGAAALMREQPSLIKRPVVAWPGGAITVGFDPAAYSEAHR